MKTRIMKYFLFLASFLAVFISFSQTTPLCFSESKFRTVGVNPQFITSGDFNNDGFPDIAATSRWLNDSITILLNSGDGITYTRNNYLVGMIPERIITADFNSDGNLDLAVATNTTLSGTSISLVYVLIGSPSGTFSAATNYTVSGYSNTLITGHFNADAILDLAVGSGMNIDFLNGNGDGTFSQSYRMTNQFVLAAYDMVGHDFNSDGKTDIAYIDNTNNNDQLVIYNFGYTVPSLPIPFGTSVCLSLTSGDYNNDGNIDIATCGMDVVSVLFGLGGGQFGSALTYTLPGAQESHGILSLDMNNDSNLDLVICEAQDRIYVLYGSANGAFIVSPTIYSTGSGSMPWSITAADFNSDGKIDFATANPTLNNVSILLNNVAPNVVINAITNSICIGSGVTLQASGAYTYSWSTGDTTSVNHQMPISPNTYTVNGIGINHCVNTQTITVSVNNTCQDIWPGDANSDGTADNLDVLELGLHYTQTGAPRTSVSNAWQSYFANNWTGTITNGKNLNHSDCNGDGTIDDNDTLAIYNNYGLTHAFKSAETNTISTQLSIVPDQAYVTKGNWGTASIYLGDGTSPISNINGLAFTIDFDNSLFETNNIYIEYQNSFIDAGQNLRFRKLDFTNGKVYTATTHTNNINVSGNGKIATLHYQIKTNLTTDETLTIGITQAAQSNASGTIVPLTSGTGTLMAIGASVGLQELNGNLISISPNPTNGSLTIKSKTELQKIEVVVITGQVLLSEVPTNVSHTLHLDNFANGIYFVNLYQNNRIVKREKVVLNK